MLGYTLRKETLDFFSSGLELEGSYYCNEVFTSGDSVRTAKYVRFLQTIIGRSGSNSRAFYVYRETCAGLNHTPL